MLPNEAWLCIAKGLSDEVVELKTKGNTLQEISRSYFVRFAGDGLIITGAPGMMGYEPIEDAIVVDYEEFTHIFPMYFSKLRFDTDNEEALDKCKYVFPLIKKYVIDKAGKDKQKASPML